MIRGSDITRLPFLTAVRSGLIMKSTVTIRNVLATASSAAGPSRSCLTSNRPLILRKIRAASTPRAFIAHRPYLSSFRPAISSRTFATHTSPKPSSSASTSSSIPDIPPQDTFDIIIIGGGNAGLALTCALRTSPLGFRIVVRRLIAAVAKPTIRSTSRILLLEGGNLDRPRSWTGDADWDNRVSSLTAENVAWLEGTSLFCSIGELTKSQASGFGTMLSNPDPVRSTK